MNTLIIWMATTIAVLLFLAFLNHRLVKTYKLIVALKNKTIDIQNDRLAHMDILVDEYAQNIDVLLKHIIQLSPEDEAAKESLIKIRRMREQFTEVWAERAKETLKDQ
jgi:hypothetical protein